jgi:hypothetical protein
MSEEHRILWLRTFLTKHYYGQWSCNPCWIDPPFVHEMVLFCAVTYDWPSTVQYVLMVVM